MNRRDFIKHIALLAAGASALPEQLEALEVYYKRNTPLLGEPFISFDEMIVSGLHATHSSPVWIGIFNGDNNVLRAGLNAFGGQYYWRAFQDMKIMMPLKSARWRISGGYDDAWVRKNLCGGISYIGQDGIRVNKQIDAVEGNF